MQGPDFAGFHESRPERAAQVAQELGVRAFASLNALLDAVDAVTIVVPTPAHFAVAQQVLARGIHALIEKPIATTLAEADEMLRLAKQHGAIVQTGHVERFNRAIRAALPYVHTPRFIESDRLAPFNPRGADVAVVLDLMIHDIDLVHTLVGGTVASVAAVGVPVLTPFVDMANARLAFDTGAVANITASRVSRERMRKIRIFQEREYISLDLAAGNGEFFRLRDDVNIAALATAPLALEQFVERIPLEADEGEPLRLEFESFLAAIRGEAPVAVTGEEGREALGVALQIVTDIERALPSRSKGAHRPARA
ncbi:MAG: Gfo/Idh/MocA family oxidoreductase [Gemmatimonadaceae bacterium]|nr:Gfo/Idh/MocA family oxidoreductase [Gemmatimonadaceae bacterium]NUO94429.1 Gfo/Idh/MocA family oxidoreductase [Gemmatimonadaceae bacterium]NUP54269.1 Gfo/Idh/MocA family oxidoreductase [Gemmatimonadaceae bacterium]NUR34751.1 Gfo/Idh/MocA family oxidoreductase [Gemmatimonadaceae bacterium]